MHSFYSFNFLESVTSDLRKGLGDMQASLLDSNALEKLRQFQELHLSTQGVYQIIYRGEVCYVGKANDVAKRLGKHLFKLSGRQNIARDQVCYKALLLDGSMSTAANEELLIRSYSLEGKCEWNGSGFGSNDPGVRRDGTEPKAGGFDLNHPIRGDFEIEGLADETTVGEALVLLKKRLPFVFRYDKAVLPNFGERGLLELPLDLSTTPRTATDILVKIASTLGNGWQAVAFVSHMILYRNSNVVYPYGTRVYP